MWPKIEFEVDEPTLVHLRFTAGKLIVSRWYDRWPGDTVQYMFCADEGMFYLTDTAGALLNARLKSRGYVAGSPIIITKRRVANPNSDRPITEYVPFRVGEFEE